ncbi:MAG: hypothetical protein ACREDJ_09290, partial [Methylocella sp.]
ASLGRGEGRGRAMAALNAPSLVATAEADPIALAAAEPDSGLASRAGGRQVPLPPARPVDRGTIRDDGVPIALR